MFRGSLRLLVLSLAVLGFSLSHASADLAQVLPELGDLQRWSVFTLGNHTTHDTFGGSAVIQGDVGVAGIGDISLQDSAAIQGSLYYRSNGTLRTDPGTQITGATIHDQDGLLDSDAAAAIATSRHAGDLRQNFSAPADLELTGNRNFTASGAPGQNVVMKLGNFTLSGNSTLTLAGTA